MMRVFLNKALRGGIWAHEGRGKERLDKMPNEGGS